MRETAERIAEGMWLKRTWYDASRVRSETVVQDRDGAPSNTVCGPHRDFDLDGRLVREVLIAPSSTPLSIDEYEQARRADPRLPPPTVQLPPPGAYAAFVAAQKSDPRYTAIRRDESDRFCTERLDDGASVSLAVLLGRGRSHHDRRAFTATECDDRGKDSSVAVQGRARCRGRERYAPQ